MKLPVAFSTAALVVAGLVSATAVFAATDRSYVTSSTVIRLDGNVAADSLKNVTVTDNATAAGTTSIAAIQFMPRSDGALTQWAETSLKSTSLPRAVDILTLDYYLSVKQIESLSRVSIQQLDLPELNAAGKDVVLWTAHLSPSTSAIKVGDGSKVATSTTQTLLHNGDFRVSIDGVADTSYVAKVGAVSVKIATTFGTTTGTKPYATIVPTITQTVSPLSFSITSSHAGSFQQWLASRASKTVTIAYLNAAHTDAVCTLTFANVVPSTLTTSSSTTQQVLQAQTSGVRISCP